MHVAAGERLTEVVGSESSVALSVLCGSGSQMSGKILGLTALRTYDVPCCKALRHLWRTAHPRAIVSTHAITLGDHLSHFPDRLQSQVSGQRARGGGIRHMRVCEASSAVSRTADRGGVAVDGRRTGSLRASINGSRELRASTCLPHACAGIGYRNGTSFAAELWRSQGAC